jgi:excisionase family DNA binding protein
LNALFYRAIIRENKELDTMDSEIRSLTTGEIAEYCDVNLRTVIRWIEAGKLKGYKLPGRGNNRVLEPDFLDFLRENGMPVPKGFDDKREPLVLIVDDETSMTKSIQRIARKAGIRSITASGGFEAGVLLSMHKPQMITLDLSMPGINGFEVLQLTRAHKEFKDIQIIVISALGEKLHQKALSLGANKAFSKPFEPSALLAEFESLIR